VLITFPRKVNRGFMGRIRAGRIRRLLRGDRPRRDRHYGDASVLRVETTVDKTALVPRGARLTQRFYPRPPYDRDEADRPCKLVYRVIVKVRGQ
jgi:hypothetical protein